MNLRNGKFIEVTNIDIPIHLSVTFLDFFDSHAIKLFFL